MTERSKQKAKVSLDIIIVGGGMTGLACAYSLREAGHNVHVLEAEDLPEAPGSAGIHCPPNMTRILFEWGLGPDILARTKGRCPKIVFASAYSGDTIGELVFHKKVMDELGAEMFDLHHSDLVHLLHRIATEAGARFSARSRVININSEAATVTLGSGEKLKADLIIGADGHESIVRSCLDLVDEGQEYLNYTAYLGTIHSSKLKDDEEILQFLEEPKWHMWMGSRWAICTFGVQNSKILSVVVLKNEENAVDRADWKRRTPARSLGLGETELSPILRRIIELVDDVVRIRTDRSTRPENWYDNNGHVVVVGEAAHPSIVGTAHTAALGIEDAVVLGRLLSRLNSKSEIKRLLSAFQEIRLSRSEYISSAVQEEVDLITLPSGPMSDARDRAMSSQLKEGQIDWSSSEEGFLRKSWEQFRDTFGYDAFDEADTWWVEWGVLLDRINGSANTSVDDSLNGNVIVERRQNHTGSVF